MKYIRTKDGIYEVKDDFIVLKGQELYLPHFQDHIIAQADTIIELCEYFLVFDDDNCCYVTEDYTDFINMYVDFERHNCLKEAFGCIKTDKGLIYAAKMNKEGELELL